MTTAAEFPVTNDPDVDVLGVLQKVRARYKIARSLMKWEASQFDYRTERESKESSKVNEPIMSNSALNF